ncbi:MAG: AGE family epimerase/isomerase [Proteobacteria bacterium]|nr:AGE family epimerase/isomerase [Pseudomonadota bacterium]
MREIPFARVRAWMFDEALPFWAQHGIDREFGGFLEELTFDGQPTGADFKRVRVMCRQLYVFSHAALLGWNEARALSDRGYDYLVARARTPEGGWARLLTRQGEIEDPTPDLYDIAFVLFGLAWRYRLTGDAAVLQLAHDSLDFVQRKMRAPHRGFWQWLPPTGPRLQNPHMHMIEASLALFVASEEERFLDQAREIAALFNDHLFDGHTLGERFTEDWRRIEGEDGRVLEPGHHFEWVWILAQYWRATGEDMTAQARALTAFAERGVDRTSRMSIDAIRDDGLPLRRTSRSWPNTERIKAHLALFEMTGADPSAPVAETVDLLFSKYLAVEPLGSWMDQFDGEGRPIAKAVPASILYHYFLCFSEVLRLEPKLRDQTR